MTECSNKFFLYMYHVKTIYILSQSCSPRDLYCSYQLAYAVILASLYNNRFAGILTNLVKFKIFQCHISNYNLKYYELKVN